MARLYGPGPHPPPTLISTSDLAGLSTRDMEGRPVGELFGALSEERTGLIRYLDVSIRGANKHVLVPIGHARIDGEAVPPRVRLRAATQEDLLAVPEFVKERTLLDAEYQTEVMSAHGRLFYGSRYYAHPAYDHEDLHAGARPVVPVPDEEPEEPHLRPLTEVAGWPLTSRGPDLMGWDVRDRDGEMLGTVGDLLVEPEDRRARYVILDLADPERPTAIPVGYIALDPDEPVVHLPTLTREDVRLLPPYDPPLTRAEENRLHAALEGRLTGDRYFDRPDFRPHVGP